MNLTDFPAVK